MSFAEVALRLYMPLGFVCALAYTYWKNLKRAWRWLSGSRTRYWIDKYGDLQQTDVSIRPIKAPMERVIGPSIELGRRFFFRRRKVCGNRVFWKIAHENVRPNLNRYVSLTSTSGIGLFDALKFINRYPRGLPSVLDRIAELEQELRSEKGRLELHLEMAQYQRGQLVAVVLAILETLNADRSRYRSKFSEGLRLFLEEVNRAVILKPEIDILDSPHPENRWRMVLDSQLGYVAAAGLPAKGHPVHRHK